MRTVGAMIGAASLGLAAVSAEAGAIQSRSPSKRRHYGASCYMPHQGDREIARRLRQAERNERRQRERAENSFAAQVENVERMSRRGRLIR